MRSFRILQAGMMLQIVLGLWRFSAPYTGVSIQPDIWIVHPLLGIAIAIAALVLFRPRRGDGPNSLWTAARYVALAPLTLGLSMRYGVVAGWPAVLAHMVLGLTALGLIDSVIKKEGRQTSGTTDVETEGVQTA